MNNKVSLQDLAEGLAIRKGISKKDAESFVRNIFDVIEHYLKEEQLVKIKGLGTFKIVSVDSRESVNVNTGERIIIDSHSKITFAPDSLLRDQVNKPFADFETVILKDSTRTEDMEYVEVTNAPYESGEEEVSAETTLEESETLETENEDMGKESPITEEDIPEEEEQEAKDEDEVEEERLSSVGISSKTEDANSPIVEEEDGQCEEIEPKKSEEPNQEAEDREDKTEEETNKSENNNYISIIAEENSTSKEDTSEQVATQTVTEQIVTTQHVEHQTVQMVTKEDEREGVKHKGMHMAWGGIFAFLLLTIILMFASFFIGFRIADIYDSSKDNTKTEQPNTAAQHQTAEPKKEAEQKVDTMKNEPIQTPEERSKNYTQVLGGSQLIVGVIGEHVVAKGDNMSKIANQYYGNEDFGIYITKFNNIENANRIPVGTKLQIPELVKK